MLYFPRVLVLLLTSSPAYSTIYGVYHSVTGACNSGQNWEIAEASNRAQFCSNTVLRGQTCRLVQSVVEHHKLGSSLRFRRFVQRSTGGVSVMPQYAMMLDPQQTSSACNDLLASTFLDMNPSATYAPNCSTSSAIWCQALPVVRCRSRPLGINDLSFGS